MPDTDPASGLPIGHRVDAAPARRPSPGTVLEGRHVRLVPLDPAAHAEALFRNAHGPEAPALWQYLGQGPFADAAAFRAHVEASAASADPFFFCILDRATGEAVGYSTLMRVDPANRVIEVGNILYTPKLQRSPGATEVQHLLMRHAFDDLGYRRYEWKCNALNAPSRRAALRYGFVCEGLFRDHMIIKGRSRDTTWFSILESEWPARRAAFERWLDPANFDAAGRQRVSLATLNATALSAEGVALRRATRDDEPDFEALQQAAYAWNRDLLGREPLPLLTPAADVIARYETWLAGSEAGLAGALALEPRADDLLIWSVSVDPGRQDDGLGRKLLAAAEIRAAQLGLTAIRLYTGAPLTKNIDWYGRRGYEIERREDLADRQVVHMIKRLQAASR